MPDQDPLPQSIEMEKALLGGILIDNKAYEKVSEYLRPVHFSLGIHRHIYDICSQVIELGKLADLKTVRALFGQEGILSDVGGWSYVEKLVAAGASYQQAGEYGACILDLYFKRELISLGNSIVSNASSASSPSESSAINQIEHVEQALYDLASSENYEGYFLSFKESAEAAMMVADANRNLKPNGTSNKIATGIDELDNVLEGLKPSDLLILAGQLSIGKTELAARIAFNAANAYHQSKGEQGAVVGVFSLKISAEDLAAMVIVDQAPTSINSFHIGDISGPEFDELQKVSKGLHDLPIFIDDTPELTARGIRIRARKLKRQHSLGLIIVDYLQLIPCNSSPRNIKQTSDTQGILRTLKQLARELNVPVLLLARLPSQNDDGGNKRPTLGDLSFIDGVEDIADTILLMFKESNYFESNEPLRSSEESEEEFIKRHDRWKECFEKCRDITAIIIAKNHNAPAEMVEI